VRTMAFLAAVGLATAVVTAGQQSSAPPSRDALAAATAADHQNMMAQLGIRRLRPGPSGSESAPNHANYDEATANPFPDLPDVLMLKNGKRVTTADMWWKQRRPEIVEDFEREVLGRVPRNTPTVTWTVMTTERWTAGARPIVGRQIIGHADNSSSSTITVDIQMTLVMPADAKRPVPVMIMFGNGLLPSAAAVGRGRGAAPQTAGGDPPAT